MKGNAFDQPTAHSPPRSHPLRTREMPTKNSGGAKAKRSIIRTEIPPPTFFPRSQPPSPSDRRRCNGGSRSKRRNSTARRRRHCSKNGLGGGMRKNGVDRKIPFSLFLFPLLSPEENVLISASMQCMPLPQFVSSSRQIPRLYSHETGSLTRDSDISTPITVSMSKDKREIHTTEDPTPQIISRFANRITTVSLPHQRDLKPSDIGGRQNCFDLFRIPPLFRPLPLPLDPSPGGNQFGRICLECYPELDHKDNGIRI